MSENISGGKGVKSRMLTDYFLSDSWAPGASGLSGASPASASAPDSRNRNPTRISSQSGALKSSCPVQHVHHNPSRFAFFSTNRFDILPHLMFYDPKYIIFWPIAVNFLDRRSFSVFCSLDVFLFYPCNEFFFAQNALTDDLLFDLSALGDLSKNSGDVRAERASD